MEDEARKAPAKYRTEMMSKVRTRKRDMGQLQRDIVSDVVPFQTITGYHGRWYMYPP